MFLKKYPSLFSSLLLSIVTLVFVSGCSTQSATTEISPNETISNLYIHEWRLVSLSGKKAAKGESGHQLSLMFDNEFNKVSGYAGCNRFFGTFTIEQNNIQVSSLGMTRKFCAKKSELEASYTRALQQATQYVIEDNNLVLSDKQNKVIAVFSK